MSCTVYLIIDSFDQLIENSHQICRAFSTLPVELVNNFELKSLHIIAECMFDVCHDILFSFVNKMDNYVCKLQLSTMNHILFETINIVHFKVGIQNFIRLNLNLK